MYFFYSVSPEKYSIYFIITIQTKINHFQKNFYENSYFYYFRQISVLCSTIGTLEQVF